MIEIVYGYGAAAELDSIAKHGRLLAGAIAETGLDSARFVSLDEALVNHESGATRVLQYNPFSYGRRGLSPRVVRDIRQLRSDRLAVYVHEPWVPIAGPKSAVMGIAQRLQLIAVARASQTLLASTESFATRVSRAAGGRSVASLPVGSNVPDRRSERAATRAELGVADDRVIVAQFASRHPARLPGHVGAALHAIEQRVERPVLMNLGSEATAVNPNASRWEVITSGTVSDDRLAALLAASDVFLSPFVDGVSTRRTSVMAALQHALPIVGTATDEETDSVFHRATSALVLTPAPDVRAFAASAAEVAADAARRMQLGTEARRLYDEHFSWPVLARRFVDLIRANG